MRTRMMNHVLLVSTALAVSTGCTKSGSSDESERGGGTNPPPAAVQHSSEGVTVTVQAKAQEQLGLQTQPSKAIVLEPEMKAYGRVLDPAALVAAVTEMQAAQNALETSRREMERVKALFQQDQNASVRTLENAESAFKRDEIARESLQLKFVAAWGKNLLGHPDLLGMLRTLAARESLLVRLDLPAGQILKEPLSGKLTALSASGNSIEASLLGPAPDVDPQTQGQGFFFLVKDNAEGLRPGQAITGYIQTSGASISAVVVPASAIIRAEGRAWVFVQTGPLTFLRREVRLDRPADGGWLIREGIISGDKLVVTGAQMLYSEELKAGIPIGD